MSRGNKGFSNKAKSGAKATTDRWRRAVERAKLERPAEKSGKKPARKPPNE